MSNHNRWLDVEPGELPNLRMALVQFENDHKRLLQRYKQKPNAATSKAFLKIDSIGKRLADKGTSPKDRDALCNKLKDAMKKLKLAIKEDVKERLKDHADALKKPEKGFNAQNATRTVNNVKREILILEKKAQQYTDSGGAAPPPPKLPEFHFGADYKSLILRLDGTLSPSVVSAFDKLDENSDAAKAIELIKAARVALEKQATPLAAEAAKTRDPREKGTMSALAKELLEFRSALKQLEIRIFLIHRLKA